MTRDCRYFREQIPRAALSDMPPEEAEELGRHLDQCSGCAGERDLYHETLRRMRSLGDVDVPRHFFVYPEERHAAPWKLFQLLSPGWRVAAACVVLAAGVFIVLSTARLHVRAGSGALTISFGPPPAAAPAAVSAQYPDTSALEAKILRIVEEKNRKESLEWVKSIRSEIAGAQKGLTRRQQAQLDTALANLESRMSERVQETARILEVRNDRSVAGLYQLVSRQRDRDMAAVENRLTGLALDGELKSSQTDAVLETLLQVAELRMK